VDGDARRERLGDLDYVSHAAIDSLTLSAPGGVPIRRPERGHGK
jgi:hypothetical protein